MEDYAISLNVQKVKQLGLEKEVVFTDFIKDQEIPALVAGTKVFAMPSFWEGFGMPALEAMSFGVPVVAGKAGSLPEIVGGAGVLVDPYVPQSIANGIEKILTQSSFRQEIIKKGKSRAKMFNWLNCSKIIHSTLKNLAF